jgi:hypothetical protein
MKKMKKMMFCTAIIGILILSSCNGIGSGPVYESKESMGKLIAKLKECYGETPAFNSIILAFDKRAGNLVIVSGNNDIKSSKLLERQLTNGFWETKTEITMEISDGKPEDFLFTLNDIDLMKFPELVSDAKSRVIKEKNISNVVVTEASITMPNNLDDRETDLNYSIIIQPSGGGTNFLLTYDLNGKFVRMSY